MKKNFVLPVVMVLSVLACILFISDGLTYLVASQMALIIIAIVNRKSSKGIKMTRWAKAHPKKAQILITILQGTLMALGIYSGYNLRELGYEFTNTTAFLCSAVILMGFLSVPFLPKRSTIAIPKVVQRHRYGYIAIALSTFIMMAVFGNRLRDDYPGSTITKAAKAIDQAIFPESFVNTEAGSQPLEDGVRKDNEQVLADEELSNKAVFAVYSLAGSESVAPVLSDKEVREKAKAEKKVKRFERKKQKMLQLLFKKRPALVAAMGIGGILLIVLLVITTCAGVCLLIAGISGGGVGTGLLGAVVAAASVFGIVKISDGNRRKPKRDQ